MSPLLDLCGVTVEFATAESGPRRGRSRMRAVDGVSLSVSDGEIVGLVGESGCGKTTLARAIVKLVPLAGGTIHLDGRDMGALSGAKLRAARSTVQMIFQDPYASLNPRMTVFDAIAEPLRVHRRLRGKALVEETGRLMESVGLARRLVRKYPHEFSGGQRQRIAVARALAVRPRLILADEPVSSLDVSIQAQVLNLLSDLKNRMKLAMLFISHDLSVVRYLSHRIAVMYRGRIVEEGDAKPVFETPAHPYTRALMSAIPVPDPSRPFRPPPLRSDALSAGTLTHGCRFRDRCPMATEACAELDPKLEALHPSSSHRAACLRKHEKPA